MKRERRGDILGTFDLAKRAIQGDEEAFLQLMKEHKDSLYRTAWSHFKNEHEAIEAVQEVTVRAYRNIHTVREPQYMKTWLIRIMLNYCNDTLKKAKRFVITEQVELQTMDNNDELLVLEEAMERLNDSSRRIVHLKYFQNATHKEIAYIERIPEGTVKSRLHYALKTMRSFFKERGEK